MTYELLLFLIKSLLHIFSPRYRHEYSFIVVRGGTGNESGAKAPHSETQAHPQITYFIIPRIFL